MLLDRRKAARLYMKSLPDRFPPPRLAAVLRGLSTPTRR